MEPRLTPKDMLEAIAGLKPKWFGYVNPGSESAARVAEVNPARRILRIERRGGNKLGLCRKHRAKPISQATLELVASALSSMQPISLDAILKGGGNTRSLLEAVVARLPEIHVVYLRPADASGAPVPGSRPHKHIVWLPAVRHASGVVNVLAAAELGRLLPSASFLEAGKQAPCLTRGEKGGRKKKDTVHVEIQAGLADVAHRIGLKSFVAVNDRGRRVNGKPIARHPGVIDSLANAPGFSGNSEAVARGKRIDMIFFDGDVIRAAIEIEHTTGVTSGLTRMNGLRSVLRGKRVGAWIIVADDSQRDLVIREAMRPDMVRLKAKFMSYSNLQRLFRVCAEGPFNEKMPIRFLSNFYEECVV